MEGDICNPTYAPCVLTDYTPPILVHVRPGFQSVTGGVVYRGSQIPALCGVYLYGDFATAALRGLRYDAAQGLIDQRNLGSVPAPSSFGYDENYEAYLLNRSDGTLYQVTAP